MIMAIDPLPMELSEWILASEPTEVKKSVDRANRISREIGEVTFGPCSPSLEFFIWWSHEGTLLSQSNSGMSLIEAAALEAAESAKGQARVAADLEAKKQAAARVYLACTASPET